MIPRSSGWILLAFLALGCGPSAKFFPMNDPPDSVLAERIEVFTQFPERDYVEIGLIKVRARSKSASSPEKMMQVLKDRARAAGADAIVITSLTGETVVTGGVKDGTGGVTSSTKDVIVATAISWK
ncbi:MAG: hypothetical protein AB1752_09730 [Candidatus Zixiibacteriota bacterium]